MRWLVCNVQRLSLLFVLAACKAEATLDDYPCPTGGTTLTYETFGRNYLAAHCQTCHGKIEEMEEVYQFAPLSMGWCINCHRETEVKKDVYRDLGIFKDLMSKDKRKVTAEDIGATNCARCHY